MSKKLLPKEILLAMLGFVSDQGQLSECRLVCKSWRRPAERCMLGQQITLKSNKAMPSLYDLLFDDPYKSSLIKYLHFDVPGSEFFIMFNELMYLAIAPNMKAIAGFVESHAFYNTMIETVDKSKLKFSKLKSMAHPKSTFPDYISHFRCYK